MNSRKRTFLICALPRSRTAWLSQFFTIGAAVCAHDLTAEFHPRGRGVNVDALARAIVEQPGSVCGSSCSGNLFILRELETRLRELTGWSPNVIYVQRPAPEVLNSFARVCGLPPAECRPIIEQGRDLLDIYTKRPGAVAANFEALDDEKTMRRLWAEATFGSGLQFPELHWRKMRKMRVELHPEIMFRAAHLAA
jgi:hypothetical protein